MVGNNTASVGLKVQNPDTALRSVRVQLAVCETAAGWWQSVSGAGTNESDCLGLSKSSSDGRAPSPRCPSHVLPHGQDKHLDFGHRTWTSKKKKKPTAVFVPQKLWGNSVPGKMPRRRAKSSTKFPSAHCHRHANKKGTGCCAKSKCSGYQCRRSW